MAESDLATVTAMIEEAIRSVDGYLANTPSPIMANARGLLGHVQMSARRESDRLLAIAEREERKTANAADREQRMKYDPFDVEMAARFRTSDGTIGIPIDQFLEWRKQRQAEMAARGGKFVDSSKAPR